MNRLWIALATLVVVCFYTFTRKPRDKNGVPYRFPPGPKGWPIVGNTFQIPSENSAPVLERFSRKYGEM